MRLPVLAGFLGITFIFAFTPVCGADATVNDYLTVCSDLESTLEAGIQEKICAQSVDLINKHDIAARIEALELQQEEYCESQEEYLYGCDEKDWLKTLVVLDAIRLALCDYSHFDATIADSHYATIGGTVYSDGEPVVRCDTGQMNQNIPFFKLPPVSQENEYPLENHGLVFDYIISALNDNQLRLFRHHLKKLDFSDPANNEAIVYLLSEAAENEQAEYFDALFAGLETHNNPENYYRQPLGAVLMAGNVKAAKQFLAAGVAATAAVSSRQSVLTLAAEQGDLELVRMLLTGGANVDGIERGMIKTGQELPLVNALKNRHFDIVDVLLAHGARVATTELFDNDRRVLSAAIQSGSYEYFSKLHQLGAKPYDDFSHLMRYQLAGKNLQILQRLFELKVKTEDRDHYDILRSIRDSLKDNYPDAVKALAMAFDNGIGIPAEPRKAFQFASSTIGLINRGFEYRKVYNASLDRAHKQMVMLVLTRLQNNNPESLLVVDRRNTLLMSAAHKGLPEAVELLLRVGADVSVEDRGKTALDKAVKMRAELAEAGSVPVELLRDYDLVIGLLEQGN